MVTVGYIIMVTVGYIRLQWVTYGYSWLHMVLHNDTQTTLRASSIGGHAQFIIIIPYHHTPPLKKTKYINKKNDLARKVLPYKDNLSNIQLIYLHVYY